MFSRRFLFVVNDIDIASYAQSNTTYIIDDNMDDLITSLDEAAITLFEQFENSLLKSNADNCNLLVSTKDSVSINVTGNKIGKRNTEKLLGVNFDKKVSLGDQMCVCVCVYFLPPWRLVLIETKQ